MKDSPKDKFIATHSHSEGAGVQENPKEDPAQKSPGAKDRQDVVNNFLDLSRSELEDLKTEEGEASVLNQLRGLRGRWGG